MSVVRVEKHPNGVRLHLGRRRWHHAHSGALCVAVGAWLIWTDRVDIAAAVANLRYARQR